MAKRKLTFLCVYDQKTGKAIVLLGGCCPQVTVEQTQHSSTGSLNLVSGEESETQWAKYRAVRGGEGPGRVRGGGGGLT